MEHKTPTSVSYKISNAEAHNIQKVYAGYIGCSGLPLGEEQKYSKSKKKIKKQKAQVYKIGLNADKGKVSYHKKSESMTQAKMKQLICNKEISFQKIVENQKNTPYTAKYGKHNIGEPKSYHAHHHSVALGSPHYQHAISSSTGSTRELKTVSNRVPKSKSKNKVNMVKGKASPVQMNKDSIHSDISDKITISQTGKLKGHATPSIKYSASNERCKTINDLMNSK